MPADVLGARDEARLWLRAARPSRTRECGASLHRALCSLSSRFSRPAGARVLRRWVARALAVQLPRPEAVRPEQRSSLARLAPGAAVLTLESPAVPAQAVLRRAAPRGFFCI